jgi:hypothetical protein
VLQEAQFDPGDPADLAAAMARLGMDSQLIVAGFDYWNGRRRGRAMPDRADLDPVIDIPTLIPHIILFDVRFEPLDFRFRLVGTHVRRNLARDYTGMWFSDLPNYNPASTIWPRHKLVAETGRPMLQRPTYVGPHRDFIAVENILLPLGVARAGWAMQLMFIDFIRRKASDGLPDDKL